MPHNLDLDELIERNPVQIKAFKKDKLAYVINLLTICNYPVEGLKTNFFIPLNSRKLKVVVNNYKAYLNYLIDSKVIKSDNYYRPGEKSKGYRLSKRYFTKIKVYLMEDFTLIQTLKREEKAKLKTVRTYKYLSNFFFNSKLEIDEDYALKFIAEEYWLCSNEIKICNERKNRCVNKYNNSMLTISKIKNQNFSLSIDNTSRRFHSNLTNLRSILRNTLTYNGEKLISIDIKNSQPYLSLLLFNYDFWSKKKKKNKKKQNY
ncbi:hypothetical protein [Lutibacter litoralis]|uniref:Uncharacterized protein n=1 Tax=Gramella jeungdoensis TaxID=708091 RepID=A0A4Y8AT89_9FLAO|nr:hypothetical protein [Lutibacter litoralis]TEW75111.1 hypothetical protein E2488_06205 [Gramella jeungdoensis]